MQGSDFVVYSPSENLGGKFKIFLNLNSCAYDPSSFLRTCRISTHSTDYCVNKWVCYTSTKLLQYFKIHRYFPWMCKWRFSAGSCKYIYILFIKKLISLYRNLETLVELMLNKIKCLFLIFCLNLYLISGKLTKLRRFWHYRDCCFTGFYTEIIQQFQDSLVWSF